MNVGAKMKDLSVTRKRRFDFDLTVPPLGEGLFVTPLGWNTADTYWEVLVDSSSICVQWLPRGDRAMWPTLPGLRTAGVPIDDGEPHHVRVDTNPVRLTVDGTKVVTVLDAPPARPVVSVEQGPRRDLVRPAAYTPPRREYPALSFAPLSTDPGSGSWHDPVDPWPDAPLS